MSEARSEPDLLNELAHQFVERYRRGEHPALTEYTRRYPELADQIRELFPALVVMEEFGSVAGQPPPAAPGPRVPRQLGEYRILREVGRGGMGVVYEAVQESLGRHVALKVLSCSGLVNGTQVERFEREARAAARLHHTNIVPVFGIGVYAGVHYYAMQFIRGRGLEAVLDEVRRLREHAAPPSGQPATVSLARGLLTGRLEPSQPASGAAVTVAAGPDEPAPPEEPPGGSFMTDPSSDLTGPSDGQYFRAVARLGVQVAEGLAYAHRQGIVHRDIKPSNLLLDAQGVVWVTDFGLVKEEDGDDLTRTGDIVGTVRYMAPERFDGGGDARSDVYSLGATLYELLVLRPAFADAHRARLVERIRHEEPVPPRRIDARIPRDLETVVQKAMAKEPAGRYQSASELAEDLRRFLGDRPVRARRSSAAERTWRWCRRNPVVASLVAAVATLLVAIAVVSSVMAWHLNREHQAAVTNWQRAQIAERDAKEKLVQSRLAQARAGHFSRQAGRHFEGLKALAEAARLARELELSPERLLELRNEAIACLALTDLRPARRLENLTWGELLTGTDVQVAFDRRWEVYARGGPGGNVSVRRLADDRELTHFTRPGQVAGLLLFSPDGQYLAAKFYQQHSDKPLEYVAWDWRQGREVVRQTCEMNMSPGMDFTFCAEGRRLILGGRRDGSLGIYDLASGRQVRRLELGIPPHCLALHPDGRRLAAEVDQELTVRSLDTGAVLSSWKPAAYVWAFAWHPDGNLLAGGCSDHRIYLWDAASGVQRGVLEGHENHVTHVTFNRAGTLLASSGWDDTTHLWDPHGGKDLVRVPGMGLQFSPDDRSLAYGNRDELGIWEVAHERVCRTLHGHRDEVVRMDFSPDGRLLASSASDGVRLWDAGTAQRLGELPLGRTFTALFHPGGEVLFTSGDRGLYRWPLRPADGDSDHLRLALPQPLPVPVGDRLEQAFCDRHGQRLAVADFWQKGIVLNLDNPARPTLLVGHDRMNWVSLSPDGRWAATGNWKGADVKVWDLAQGERPAPVHTIPSGVARAVFSPDGRWLVVEEVGVHCRWFRVGSWEQDREDQKGVRAVAFAANAPVMAEQLTAGGSVTLRDPETGRELGTLTTEDTSLIATVALSGDGNRLAAGTKARAIQLWDLRAVRGQLAEMGLDWEPPPGLPEPGRPLEELDRDFARRVEAITVRPHLDRIVGQLDRQLAAARGQREEAALLFHRGSVRARLTQWQAAAADLARAVQLDPDNQNISYHLVGVLLWRGDRDGYRQHCQDMLRRFGHPTSPFVAERTAKARLLLPDPETDREQLVRLMEQAMEGTEKSNPWFIQSRGLAELRAGRPGSAVKWVEAGRQQYKAAPAVYTALGDLLLSLAYRQLKENNRAREMLGEAARVIDNDLPRENVGDLGDGWLDWVFCQVLRREAEALLSQEISSPKD